MSDMETVAKFDYSRNVLQFLKNYFSYKLSVDKVLYIFVEGIQQVSRILQI